MIAFKDVRDDPPGFGNKSAILYKVNVQIPQGRYALLADDNAFRRPVIDLISGTRPPTSGRVVRNGLCSWAIGRPSFLRGRTTGYELIRLVARLYHLDRRLCEGIVAEAVTDSERLDHPVTSWDASTYAEFGHILGLLPNFDIFVLDGVLPYRKGRFPGIWKALFEQRVAGKTLIMSTSRSGDAIEFCERALIIDGGQIRISDQLEQAIVEFPPRPAPEGTGSSAESVLVDTGGDLV